MPLSDRIKKQSLFAITLSPDFKHYLSLNMKKPNALYICERDLKDEELEALKKRLELQRKKQNKSTNSEINVELCDFIPCLLYTSPSPRDATLSRMPSSA